MSQYDERLLASAPVATRAEKQEGYNVDLLEGPQNTTSGKNSPPLVPPTAPLAPNVDQAENGLRKEEVYNKYDTPTTWYKTKKGIIIIVIAIVIVAAVIGGAVGGTVNKHNNNSSQSTGEGQTTPQGGNQGGQAGQPAAASSSTAASHAASASVDPGANSGNGGGGLLPSISKATVLFGVPAPTNL